MTSVYLAGGIGGLTPEKAVGWRRAAGKILSEAGFIVLDPTARIDFKHQRANPEKYDASNDIVIPDLEMIKASDILLVEMTIKDRPYIGTSMEIVYGKVLWQKLIYVWGGLGSYWIKHHADKIFSTLEGALAEIVG